MPEPAGGLRRLAGGLQKPPEAGRRPRRPAGGPRRPPEASGSLRRLAGGRTEAYGGVRRRPRRLRAGILNYWSGFGSGTDEKVLFGGSENFDFRGFLNSSPNVDINRSGSVVATQSLCGVNTETGVRVRVWVRWEARSKV